MELPEPKIWRWLLHIWQIRRPFDVNHVRTYTGTSSLTIHKYNHNILSCPDPMCHSNDRQHNSIHYVLHQTAGVVQLVQLLGYGQEDQAVSPTQPLSNSTEQSPS